MSKYIYNIPSWPEFTWDKGLIGDALVPVRHDQGRLLGRMEAMGLRLRRDAVLATLTEDVVKTSEIEGESLARDDVRSSLARRLGLETAGLKPADRTVEGIVEIMLDATRAYDKPLTERRLQDWHAALFPTGRSGVRKITVADWRKDEVGPMQVVSGAIGKEHVHYEAPPSGRLREEMKGFVTWFNQPPTCDPVLHAALAHLRFVTIHPFDDGNGRIARAIGDMALARCEQTEQRFYSVSSQIRHERNAYYEILERTQRGNLEVTDWLLWFLDTVARALANADTLLAGVLHKAAIWDRLQDEALSERQRKVINRLLDGFTGNLTTSKWAALAQTSTDTALRDITNLLDRGILVKAPGGGRSTNYVLAF